MAEPYEGAFGVSHSEAMLAAYREFLRAYAILPLTDGIVVQLPSRGPRFAAKVNASRTWIS